MRDKKTEKLLRELAQLRQRVAELESAETERVRKTEAKYHQLVQEINDVIYAVDRNGIITFVSPAIEPISGYLVSDIVGRSFANFVHPDDVAFVEAQFKENISGEGDLAQFRFRVLTKTGDIRWVRTFSRPALEQDRVVALRGVITDITAQVQAQEALQQRNRELELLNKAEQAFLSTLELDPVLATVLDQMRQLLGITACSAWLVDPNTDELICRQITNPQGELVQGWRLAPGQGLAGWVVEHGKSLNVADVLADDRHYKVIDQQTGLPLRSILTVPLKIRGRVIGVLQAVDVALGRFSSTDEALVESLATTAAVAVENARLYEELKASQEWARNIIDSSMDAIIAVDVNRHIVEFNRAAQEIFGYSPEQVLGKHVEMLYADRQQASSVYKTTIEKGRHVREITNRRKDGATFPSLLSASVLQNDQGQLVGVMGVSRDITERVLAEQELDRHRDHLEELVAERTHELAEANERLKELDRLKSKFITDISHELRTPLANVRLYLGLLKSGRAEKREHYMTILEGQIDQLIRFFEDILAFSTLELEKSRFAATDLNLIVSVVIDRFKAQVRAKGLELTFEPDAGLPPVRAAPRQIDRLVTELVNNALTYTPAGQVTVRTCTTPDDADACLQVRDTGRGILPEDMDYIFRRFYRGRGAGSSNIAGTGLGLSMVREIVNLHSGRIQVESQVGQGSTFTVWLPVMT